MSPRALLGSPALDSVGQFGARDSDLAQPTAKWSFIFNFLGKLSKFVENFESLEEIPREAFCVWVFLYGKIVVFDWYSVQVSLCQPGGICALRGTGFASLVS